MKARQGFSGKAGFIAAAAGGAVGLGNIWRFPFEVGEGGGAAFILIYLVFCFMLCFPLLVTEIAIGRSSGKNQVAAYPTLGHARWSLLGGFGMLTGVLILSFYNVVAAWCFGYFIEISMGNFDIGQHFSPFIKDAFKISSYALVFMLATVYIVSRGITKGIEKYSKVLMPALVAIILFITGYSLTLPGACEGIKFYLLPDLSQISFEMIYSAMGHAFFSLSLGLGAMTTYGSYVKRQDNILSSAMAITLADTGVAFFSGLMLFPLVFSEGLATDGGPGLIFMALPTAFESLGPTPGVVIGGLFFMLLSLAALTSTVSILEIPVSWLSEDFKMGRKRATWTAALVVLAMGIPSLLANGHSDIFTHFITYPGSEEPTDFMTFLSDLAGNTFLPAGGFLTAVFTALIWKKDNLASELASANEKLIHRYLSSFVIFSIRYLCPWILGALFVINLLKIFFGSSLI